MKKLFLFFLFFSLNIFAVEERCQNINSFKEADKYLSCLNGHIAKNDFYATKQMAYFYYASQKKDYKKAIEWYSKIADQDTEAQENLGIIYFFGGHGIEKDYQKSFYWNEKGMINGSLPCKMNTASAYLYGHGVPQNCKKAIQLYEEAANNNAWYAQDMLGHLYFEGKCVEKNVEKAKLWIRKGIKNGNTNMYFWNQQNWGPIK